MVGGKYIDGQYIMQMKSLNKEPMEHGRSRVFQEHVEALTKDGLIESKVLIISKYFTVFENYRKVSFNIASEASYVYDLSRQEFIQNAKKKLIWLVFKNLKLAIK